LFYITFFVHNKNRSGNKQETKRNETMSATTTVGTTKTVAPSKQGGWSAVFGCTYKGMALFRILLGVLLTAELVLRFRFLHVFYTDEGYVP
jgi:hypothetical protein